MTCPLCTSSRCVVVTRTQVADLRAAWRRSIGFDPFPPAFSAKYVEMRKCAACQLEYFDPPCYGDADFYARMSSEAWYYEENKWEFEVAAGVVAKLMPKNLLEIGCGHGFFLEKIAPLGANIEGVEINAAAVAACEAKGLKVAAADVLSLTRPYDIVVLFQVLEHMDNARELFERLTSTLVRPGGHVIIAVPNPEGYLKEMDLNLMDMPPHHNSRWGLPTFEHLQSQFGLQLVEHRIEPLRYIHYLGLLQNAINEHARLAAPSWKRALFFKAQSMALKLAAPLAYTRDRDKIGGQTHLVVLKNAG